MGSDEGGICCATAFEPVPVRFDDITAVAVYSLFRSLTGHPTPIRTTHDFPSFNDQIRWQQAQHSQVSSSASLPAFSSFSSLYHPQHGSLSTSSMPAPERAESALACSVTPVPAPALVMSFQLPTVATSQYFFRVFFHSNTKVLIQNISSDGRLSSSIIHNLTFTLILHPIGQLLSPSFVQSRC